MEDFHLAFLYYVSTSNHMICMYSISVYQNNSEYMCVCDFMHQCIRFLDSKFSSSSLSQVVCAPEEGSEDPQFHVTSGIIEGSNELNFKREGTNGRMSLIPMTFGFLRPRK